MEYEAHLTHDELAQIVTQKGLNPTILICRSETISSDPSVKTEFELIQDFRIAEGDEMFDIFKWRSDAVQCDTNVSVRGYILGYIEGECFVASQTIKQSMVCDVGGLQMEFDVFLGGTATIDFINDFSQP